MTLEEQNLTPSLNSKDSLAEKGDSLTSSMDFDSTWERGVIDSVSIRDASITNAKIKNFNFNQGTGGTLTLGGTTDGNGVLSVKNNSGSEIVRADNTGLTVTNGSITIQNSSGSNVIDSAGLVSLTAFVFGGTENGDQRDFNSSSYADVANTSVTTPNFTRTTNVSISYNVLAHFYLFGSDAISYGKVILNIDGTDQTSTVFDQAVYGIRIYTSGVFSFDSITYSLSANGVRSLGTGTHTLKLRAYGPGATDNQLRITATSVNYTVLGN
jgi:hypothetical protein